MSNNNDIRKQRRNKPKRGTSDMTTIRVYRDTLAVGREVFDSHIDYNASDSDIFHASILKAVNEYVPTLEASSDNTIIELIEKHTWEDHNMRCISIISNDNQIMNVSNENPLVISRTEEFELFCDLITESLKFGDLMLVGEPKTIGRVQTGITMLEMVLQDSYSETGNSCYLLHGNRVYCLTEENDFNAVRLLASVNTQSINTLQDYAHQNVSRITGALRHYLRTHTKLSACIDKMMGEVVVFIKKGNYKPLSMDDIERASKSVSIYCKKNRRKFRLFAYSENEVFTELQRFKDFCDSQASGIIHETNLCAKCNKPISVVHKAYKICPICANKDI